MQKSQSTYGVIEQIASNSTLGQFQLDAQILLKGINVSINDLTDFIILVGTSAASQIQLRKKLGEDVYVNIINLIERNERKDIELWDLVWVYNGKVQQVLIENEPLPNVAWRQVIASQTSHKVGLLQPRRVVNRPSSGW